MPLPVSIATKTFARLPFREHRLNQKAAGRFRQRRRLRVVIPTITISRPASGNHVLLPGSTCGFVHDLPCRLLRTNSTYRNRLRSASRTSEARSSSSGDEHDRKDDTHRPRRLNPYRTDEQHRPGRPGGPRKDHQGRPRSGTVACTRHRPRNPAFCRLLDENASLAATVGPSPRRDTEASRASGLRPSPVSPLTSVPEYRARRRDLPHVAFDRR
jgi:hypothetical protein